MKYLLFCLMLLCASGYSQSGCYQIDWETDCNGNPFPEGFYVTPDAYDCIGVTINNYHPNPLVLFNSADPTGGDVDLGTPSQNCPTCTSPCPGVSNDPNSGITNCTAEGLIIITEENPEDANGDGLEDEPDDIIGGDYELCFDAPVTVSTMSFIDDSNGFITFTYSDGSTFVTNLIGGLDNDAFTQVFNESDVSCVRIEYTTSGAMSLADFCFDDPAVSCDLVAPVLGPDVEVCEGTDPGPIVVEEPASSSATIAYQWQQSLIDCTGGFGDISGATASTYDPGPLVEDTYFRVLVSTDDGTIVCVEESNCIAYTATTAPSVEIFPVGTVCIDDPAFEILATPNGGTFSGTGITNANLGTFNPSTAGLGTHTITYNFSSGACSGSDTETVTVEQCCPDPNCFGVNVSRI